MEARRSVFPRLVNDILRANTLGISELRRDDEALCIETGVTGVTGVMGLVSGRAMPLVTITYHASFLAGSWRPAYTGLVTALALRGPSPAPSPHSSGARWYALYAFRALLVTDRSDGKIDVLSKSMWGQLTPVHHSIVIVPNKRGSKFGC